MRPGPGKEIIPRLREVGARYVALERAIRFVIDQVVSPVCATCTRVCCKASYCRRTLSNPWYRFLHETFGEPDTIAWGRSDPPPGLGPRGCVLRAGRYAYCYAYNCWNILDSLKSPEERAAFQELSDLLKNLGLNFAGKRHLTDIRHWGEITSGRLTWLDKRIGESAARFHELCSRLSVSLPEHPALTKP